MHLIIFKTNVVTREQACSLLVLLNALPPVTQCNFDLEDCDSILRIVSTDLETQLICQLLQTEGFHCEALESFVYYQ
ncbi:MAG TPA: hypothetical protein VGC08_12390 [Pedobacter sp.]